MHKANQLNVLERLELDIVLRASLCGTGKTAEDAAEEREIFAIFGNLRLNLRGRSVGEIITAKVGSRIGFVYPNVRRRIQVEDLGIRGAVGLGLSDLQLEHKIAQ